MSKWRRNAKTALKALLAALGAIALLAGGLIAYAASDKEDTFVIQNAELADAGHLQRLESQDANTKVHRQDDFPVYAHRLKRGTGTVVGFRAYSPGSIGIIDDESYRKITVWIAGPTPTSPVEIRLGQDSQAQLVFSDGGSAWPRSGCAGYGASGVVRLEPRNGKFTVTIGADINRAGSAFPERCGSERVDLTFTAKEILFEALTPWLGSRGDHPYEETYR